jgi:hypothetical protein
MNKIILKTLSLATAFALMLTLAGCSAYGAGMSEPSSPSGAVGDTTEGLATLNIGPYTTAYELMPEDVDASWDNSATTITLNETTAHIAGPGASYSGSTLTINKTGTYLLSGTLLDGQVLIDAGKNDVVRLVMNGVILHNETAPAIYAAKSGKVVIILADGSVNAVSDGSVYSSTGNDEPDAAIYVKDNLSITGNGELRVDGNFKHGVRAQDYLAITGGTFMVNAVGDALRGRDGVAVSSGTFDLTASGDGIQSNNDEDDSKGFVVISGGDFDIQSANDGIQAASSLTITSGTFNIITGGGSANAPVKEEDFRGGRMGGGMWGGMWGAPGGGVDPASKEPSEGVEPVESGESDSMKAIKAGKQLAVTGGSFFIDAQDDAVHSNGTVLVTGGVFDIETGDDGFHADESLIVSGGAIKIPTCYEGIEGKNVTITGGDIYITASDDGINAAGGVDSAFGMRGPMGVDSFASNGDIFIRISGGVMALYALRDGVDANGDVFIEGGMVKVSGPSQGMEGAIDLDGTLLITGGELITAGSVLNVSPESTQAVLLVSYREQIAAGSLIEVMDSNGNVLLSYESLTACSMSGFTSPSFVIGETYSLAINGMKRCDVGLVGVVTSVGDDGGVYNGGWGFGRGNWGGWNGNGGMEPGGQGGGRP